MGTGCDKIDDAALTAAGIALLNVPEFCTEEMADHSFALLLSIVRKLPQMQQAVLAGRWTSSRLECQAIPRLRGTTIGEHNRLPASSRQAVLTTRMSLCRRPDWLRGLRPRHRRPSCRVRDERAR